MPEGGRDDLGTEQTSPFLLLCSPLEEEEQSRQHSLLASYPQYVHNNERTRKEEATNSRLLHSRPHLLLASLPARRTGRPAGQQRQQPGAGLNTPAKPGESRTPLESSLARSLACLFPVARRRKAALNGMAVCLPARTPAFLL